MSSTLLLCSSSLRNEFLNNSVKFNNDVEYKYFFINTEVNHCSKEYVEDWTMKFDNKYPYISLKEGQVFEFNGKLYYVRTVKEGRTYPSNPRYRNVWFSLK